MESQTEQSQSTDQAQVQEAPSLEVPSLEVPTSAPEPLDLSQESNNAIEAAGAAAAEPPVPEEEPAPEPAIEVAAEPAPLVEPALSFPEATYTSLEDVDSSAFPEQFREHVTRIVELASSRAAEISTARESYESAKSRMMDLVSHMETADGKDAGSLVEHIDSQNMAIDLLLSEVTQTAFSAFSSLHSELRTLPKHVQQEVEAQFSAIGTRYTNGNVLNQMEEAYQFALYKSKWQPAAKPAPAQAAPAAAPVTQKLNSGVEKVSTPANVDARKQSVVADGSVASTTPQRDVDEMSWDELLNRNLHLIA